MKYKQLKLIYEKLYTLSLEVKNQIDQECYNDIAEVLKRKDSLLANLKQTRQVLKEKEYPEFIKEIEEKLKKQELSNIKRLQSIRDNLRVEKKKVNKDIKLLSAYSSTDTASKIIDVIE